MTVADEIANNKEVTEKTGFLDDAEFELKAVDDGLNSRRGGWISCSCLVSIL